MITETEPKGWADLEAEYQSLTGRTAERPVWDFIGKLVALVRRLESALSAAQGECERAQRIPDLEARLERALETRDEIGATLDTAQQRIAELEREVEQQRADFEQRKAAFIQQQNELIVELAEERGGGVHCNDCGSYDIRPDAPTQQEATND
jgi:DNA repair exonuclease SbcCD ATPase subunit